MRGNLGSLSSFSRHRYHVRMVVPESVVGVTQACHSRFHLRLELDPVSGPERVNQRVRQRPGALHEVRPLARVLGSAARDHLRDPRHLEAGSTEQLRQDIGLAEA